MAVHGLRFKSGFSYVQAQQNSSWTGRTSDQTLLREWYVAKLLYPKLKLRNTWTVPPREDDEPASLEDADNNGFISDLAFSRDGRKLVAGCTNKNLYIFEPNTGKSRAIIRGAHADAITRVCFVSETQFVSGSADASIALWDIRKSVQSVNMLLGHTKPIRSLDYDYGEDLLVSSSFDCTLRYWYIPSLQVERSNTENEETENYRGVFLTCPNLTQASLFQDFESRKIACLNTQGTLYIIDNLNLRKLKSDMSGKRLDDSLALQLSWFTPNADLSRRNRLRIIQSDDYCPDVRAKVSKIHFVTFHPSLPLLLLRVSTTKRITLQPEIKDWTCLCNLQQVLGVSQDGTFSNHYTAVGAFGTDILEEKLIYAEEEKRFATLREKRSSFSKCGRLIASPGKHGVQLLSFSKELHLPLDYKKDKNESGCSQQSEMSSLFSAQFWPTMTKRLTTVSLLERPVDSTMCVRFSPHDFLLAVGDANEHVSFFQPVV